MSYYTNIINELKNNSFTERRTGRKRSIALVDFKDEIIKLRLNVWMEDDEWDYLKEVCENHNITLATLFKVILKDFVKKHKKNDYFFKRFGI